MQKNKNKPDQIRMMQTNYRMNKNKKLQGLFLCRNEIEKLRQKVLNLIDQPCRETYFTAQDFHTHQQRSNKKSQTKVSLQKSSKKKPKSKGINNINCIQSNIPCKKLCPCNQYFIQSKKQKTVRSLSAVSEKYQRKKNSSNKKLNKERLNDKSMDFFFKSEKKPPNVSKKLKNISISKKKLPSQQMIENKSTFQSNLRDKRQNKCKSIKTQSTAQYLPQILQRTPSSIKSFKHMNTQTQRAKLRTNDTQKGHIKVSKVEGLNQFSNTKFSHNGKKLKLFSKESKGQIKIDQNELQQIYQSPKKISESRKSDDNEECLLSPLSSRYVNKYEEQDCIKQNIQVNVQQHKELLNQNGHRNYSSYQSSKTSGIKIIETSQKKKNLTLSQIRQLCDRTERFVKTQIRPFSSILFQDQIFGPPQRQFYSKEQQNLNFSSKYNKNTRNFSLWMNEDE